MLFVLDKQGKKVATVTMWFTNVLEKTVDRIHWVAVDPNHQGKKITHAMLNELLSHFDTSEVIYLTTQTWSYRAISIYYKFGFRPFPYEKIDKHLFAKPDIIFKDSFENTNIARAWEIINKKINEKMP